MSKIKKLLLIAFILIIPLAFSLRINSKEYGISTPCACMKTSDSVGINMNTLREIIEDNKVDGLYPDFEIIKKEYEADRSNSTPLNETSNFSLVIKSGIYYKLAEDRKSYEIKGYAYGSIKKGIAISIFGIETINYTYSVPGFFDIENEDAEFEILG